ncbi:MAG: hypothetical protein CMH36_12000 [Microbacterium sp.]|uniref:Helix-turn-helix domain-containing protein n=1 Tax=Microbacterium ginsengisoli TaxID=400772 RepID=A0A3C1KA02_9MICO|nr:helix-turn-helix domain-containing protein [uncultured Microbacterium sp.]MAL07529.1 hypothetical protein [Microbacterium sp.]HAN23500.1 hypothetical protein [Microbacterium ginsengisoli]|tara:strand:+ start:276 stop:491 length:216 start_codon:yes stop_codon:yes gene_type:complete
MSEERATRQKLLTEAELAEELQVPTRTIRYWRESGTGPTPLKMGKHTRYRASDIDAWLDGLSEAPKASKAS